MDDFLVIKQYLNENILEPLPRYIYLKEIERVHETDKNCIDLQEKIRESKWYRQLENGMLEDGSYGRFHTMDSKDKTGRVFKTTEEAIRRMKDVGLSASDKLVQKVCNIMCKYITGEANWSDRIEKHYGFEKALNSMVGANMALLEDTSEETQRYKKLCAFYIEESFHGGEFFQMDIWNRMNYDNYDFMLKPFTVHILWLLNNNPYISEKILHKFMYLVLTREEGIYYLYDNMISKFVDIEDKHFLKWLNAITNINRVNIFTGLITEELKRHLYKQALKIINKETHVPKSGPVFGHYHESWRKDELCRCDMVLRIARVIAKT